MSPEQDDSVRVPEDGVVADLRDARRRTPFEPWARRKMLEAADTIEALLHANADLERKLGVAGDALEPFSLLADGANMHDPLSKWFTVAQLKDALAALKVIGGDTEDIPNDHQRS